MIALEDQPFLLYFLSDERLIPVLSQTHTFGFALYLHSPSVYQTFLRFAVISFTWFSSLLSFHLSACRGYENRGGTWRLNCSLFMLSSCVNTELSCVNWILQLVVTENLHGDVGYLGDTTQSHTRSCHIFLPFNPKHTSSKQEQDLMISLLWFCLTVDWNRHQWNVCDV